MKSLFKASNQNLCIPCQVKMSTLTKNGYVTALSEFLIGSLIQDCQDTSNKRWTWECKASAGFNKNITGINEGHWNYINSNILQYVLLMLVICYSAFKEKVKCSVMISLIAKRLPVVWKSKRKQPFSFNIVYLKISVARVQYRLLKKFVLTVWWGKL